MAPDFRIFIHRNSDNLHLKLMGDFDGASAGELLNVLKKSATHVYKVIIHTGSLKNIYPFGRETFQENLRNWKVDRVQILFTGENASLIAPEKSVCL
ncbi:MAG: hypothetical protein JRL30_07150 [Deltaproteobacteria bacterium]|jgi:hypothetical protein|nr:hypothetical protein [Deltaproteobacteria bacterium]